MNEVNEKLSRGGRLQISIIALVFFGPLLLATWMYATGRLQPDGSTNHGQILQPLVNLAESFPQSRLLDKTAGGWRLIYVNTADCDPACAAALHKQRQIWLMLGKEGSRVARLFLHGSVLPDRVLVNDDGLIPINDSGLAEVFENARPAGVSAGGIYLVDPLDNLIMYFAPDVVPGDMVDDLKHLLKLSRIG